MPPQNANPFQATSSVAKKLKVLLYGGEKTGKTVAAMSFPRIAYIDTERGTDLYLDSSRPDIHILRTLDFAGIENALEYIKSDNGKSYDTLVIDSITPIYQLLLESEIKRIEKKNSRDNAYTMANLRIRFLYNDLVNLPVHVVVTARETVLYKSNNGYFEAIGSKPDSSRDIGYPFDFIISLNRDHHGTVEGQRGKIQLPNSLPKVEWSVFKAIADAYAQGATVEVEDERKTLERDLSHQLARGVAMPQPADPNDMTVEANARAFVATQQDNGVNQGQLKIILGITHFTAWTKGVDAANKMVEAWIESQLKETGDGSAATGTDRSDLSNGQES